MQLGPLVSRLTSRRTAVGALVVLAVALAAVVVVTRLGGGGGAPAAWTPPAGFAQTTAIDLVDGTHVALWSGHVSTPKEGDCWYLVQSRAGVDTTVGGCGAATGQPWVVRLGGAVAGGTGGSPARFVRVDSGTSMAVNQGYFLGRDVPTGPTAVVELLDVEQHRLARFPNIPVGGDI